MAPTQTIAPKRRGRRPGARRRHLAKPVLTELPQTGLLRVDQIAALEAMLPLIAERRTLGDDNAGLLWSTLRRSYDSKAAKRKYPPLARVARGAYAHGHIVDALHAAFASIDLRPWVDISQARMREPLKESASSARQRLKETLAAAIEHREAELNGTAPKAA